jgi:hypothetical protein
MKFSATILVSVLLASTEVAASPQTLSRAVTKRDCDPPSLLNCVEVPGRECEYCCDPAGPSESEHCHIENPNDVEVCLLGSAFGAVYHCDNAHEGEDGH